MTQPMTNRPSSVNMQTTSMDGSIMTKVALIVEHDLYELDTRVIDELVRLLSPSRYAISLIHLLKDVTGEMSIHPDNLESLSKSIQERTQRQLDTQQDFKTFLLQLGFSIIDERTYGMKPENLQGVMDYIQQSGQELAVFCGDYSTTSMAMRHNAFMPLLMHLPVSAMLIKRPLVSGRSKIKVLLGVDESEASMTAARKLGVFFQPESIEVTVATVQSPVYQDNAVLAPFVNQDVLNEALEANANMIFEMTRDILEASGISVYDVKRFIGSPAAELGNLAKMEEPDLVVVGSHNRKGVMAWLMGSVSSQLLQWDTHNILIVR